MSNGCISSFPTRLILDLDNMAGTHGMAIQNVVISAPQTESSSQTAASSISSSKQRYDSLTLKFSTVASYETFQQFLLDLETSLRIVDLVSLRLSQVASGDTKNPTPTYSFDIAIRTYWLK